MREGETASPGKLRSPNMKFYNIIYLKKLYLKDLLLNVGVIQQSTELIKINLITFEFAIVIDHIFAIVTLKQTFIQWSI